MPFCTPYVMVFIFVEHFQPFSLFGHSQPHLQPSSKMHMSYMLYNYIEARDQPTILCIAYNISNLYHPTKSAQQMAFLHARLKNSDMNPFLSSRSIPHISD